jgi:hypothetical protein
MDYKTKSVRVEAAQWDPAEVKKAWSALPYWMLGALDLTDNRLYGKIRQVGDNAQVVTGKGTVMAEPGDWIVYWISTTQELTVHKPEEFKRLFDVDERRARMRSSSEKPRNRGVVTRGLPQRSGSGGTQ